MEELFVQLDVNADGFVSRTELIKAVRKDPSVAEALGVENSPEALSAFFSRMDVDGSKTITRFELSALSQTASTPLESGFGCALALGETGEPGVFVAVNPLGRTAPEAAVSEAPPD